MDGDPSSGRAAIWSNRPQFLDCSQNPAPFVCTIDLLAWHGLKARYMLRVLLFAHFHLLSHNRVLPQTAKVIEFATC